MARMARMMYLLVVDVIPTLRCPSRVRSSFKRAGLDGPPREGLNPLPAVVSRLVISFHSTVGRVGHEEMPGDSFLTPGRRGGHVCVS